MLAVSEKNISKQKQTGFDNDLFLRTARGERVERPPVWLMRQAGRTLPGYRKLRASLSGFKELVKTPACVVEASIEPVDLLGVDVAIIFSDILVIPEAMGLPYELIEKKGPLFPNTITKAAQVEQLQTGQQAADELEYVYEGVRLMKQELNQRVPLIGFAGAPWTLFAYMIEGSGSKTFSKAKRMLYKEPALSHALMQKITDATIAYLKQKIAAGVDLVQVFDSWAGILTPDAYRTFALPYLKKIASAIQEVPVTIFAKGAWFAMEELRQVDCQVIGVDWNTTPQQMRAWVGEDKVLQGNLDPCQLYASTTEVEKATIRMMQQFGRKHIANLGHGVYKDTPFDSIKCFVDTVKAYTYA
ncbi:MAG: uroporphyrinogen decarboxylase [Bacteroidota bacterium]